LNKPDIPTGPLDARTAGQVIAHYLPDGAIISDEGATAGGGMHRFAATIAPHDHLTLTGGAIGQGIPLATGAAVACPDRKVVCLHGDGGAMYTLQALWTQAREQLDVTTVTHPPWPLHRAEVVALEETLLRASGLPEPSGAPVALYSPGVSTRFAPRVRLG